MGAHDEFRARVCDFLKSRLPDDWEGIGALSVADRETFREDWRRDLVANGFIAPTWPPRYGGLGLDHVATAILAQEFSTAGVPRGVPTDVPSVQMIGNLILDLCAPEVQQRFLPGIVDGSIRFCQGFSEPGSGSDLGSVRTRAVKRGHQWIINGQKIWTSNATHANWIFLLCRTDLDAGKYGGLSLLLAPLDPQHAEIRPIRMLNGEANFCEVFMDDLTTDVGLEVGGEGGGWAAATRLLTYERGATAAVLPVRLASEIGRLWSLISSRGLDTDAAVRRDFASCWARVQVMITRGDWGVQEWAEGKDLGPDSSFQKLEWSEFHAEVTQLAMRVLGQDVLAPTGAPPASFFMCDEPGARYDSSAGWVGVHLSTYGETLAAGTSEIQRNVIAERVLGLPKGR